MTSARAQMAALTFDLVDEMIAELKATFDAGGELPRREVGLLLEQLILDRSRLRAMTERALQGGRDG